MWGKGISRGKVRVGGQELGRNWPWLWERESDREASGRGRGISHKWARLGGLGIRQGRPRVVEKESGRESVNLSHNKFWSNSA